MSVEAPVSGIEEVITDLEEGFALFDDWEDRYRYLMEMGRELPVLTEAEKVEANLVPGCQSRVWFIPRREGDQLFFRINSDAAIVQGLMALVLRVFNGRTAGEIREVDPNFLQRLGLGEHISLSRRNGVAAVLARVQAAARG
ncbi:SufE family protein [Roseococcus pinisoli]|uniref:SufE family protein n=1 Tax=Roseococcus pinisoli TaxID=2835040 RepID=A0ABS5Q842_9PROT|nr:SufE family protein [Roseococcus pinisoli]MBS7809841.1 SufE family protein [Roseococcus pinisoli]